MGRAGVEGWVLTGTEQDPENLRFHFDVRCSISTHSTLNVSNRIIQRFAGVTPRQSSVSNVYTEPSFVPAQSRCRLEAIPGDSHKSVVICRKQEKTTSLIFVQRSVEQ